MGNELVHSTYFSGEATPFEKEQRRKTLTFVIAVLFSASLALTIYNLQFHSVLSLVSLGCVDVLCLVAFALNAAGNYATAAILCTSMSLLALTFNVYDGYGLFDSGMVAYPLVIILGAMLLGRSSIKWFTFAALLSLFLIGYLQWSGHIRVNARADKIGGLLPISVFIALAGLIIRAIMRDMEFNLDRIKRTDRELRQVNDTLEERVAQREAELREAHSRLVESEKLATLGRIGATVAHEMNTPLGAMISSSSSALTAVEGLAASLRVLLTSGTERDRDLLARLLERRIPVGLETDRTARKAALELLETCEAENPELLADYLLECGLGLERETVEAVVEASRKPGGTAALEALFELASLETLSKVISEAAQKSHHVVNSLRSRLAMGSASGRRERLDLGAELSRALDSLSRRLGPRIQVDWNRPESLFLEGDPNRLGMVWENLLKNALDAMGREGRLRIACRTEDKVVVVSIEDSGPGIAAEHRSLIFKPFFTTKGMGAGLGLGLDTAQHIVEEHGGSIGFESEPGRTTFSVRLPLLRPS